MGVIRKGVDNIFSGGGKPSVFLTLKDGDSVTVAILGGLEEVLSVDEHSWWDYTPAPHLVCLGTIADCPSCQLGHQAKTKSYLPVVTQDGEVKFLIAGTQIINALKELESEVGNLNGVVIRVKRNGSGLKTRYVTMGTGKQVDVSRFDIPDLEPALGPLTWDEQVEELAKIVDVSGLTRPGSRKSSKKPSASIEALLADDPEAGDPEGDDLEADGAWASF